MVTCEVISSVVENVAGHDVLPLIGALKDKQNVSEFTLAEELHEEINTIRNMLYRLYDSNLVRFTRKKDKKKGWYIYYWTFMPTRIPFLSKKLKKILLEKLQDRLKREEGGNFFECGNKCMRIDFDQAVDFDFKCPECGDLMNQEDNASKKEAIKKEIEILKKEIASVPDVIEDIEIEDIEEEIGEEKPVKVAKKKEVKKVKPVKKAKKIVLKKKPAAKKKVVKKAKVIKKKTKKSKK